MDYLRQIDILHPEEICFPVTLIGCGGIGSLTALALSKLGCPKITLFDPDVVEEINIPNQVFRLSDIGKAKVLACKSVIQEFSECEVTAIPSAFDQNHNISGIVISAVDTMASRLIIWEKMRYNIDVPLYIDGRLGGEILEVLTIQPSQIADIDFYKAFLFTDSEAAKLPCTARNIIYTGFAISAFIVSQLKHWLRKEKYYRRVNFDLRTMTSVFQE